MSTTDYIPSASGWVRKQVETIEATGDTRSVHIMNLPVVMLTMLFGRDHVLGRIDLGLAVHGLVGGGVLGQPGASLVAIGGFFGGVVEVHDLSPVLLPSRVKVSAE